ncbi:MAG TPA: GNVR domain-containing protein, partial [bacterium]|nr:GNVR domain-containing protein [bacterium]
RQLLVDHQYSALSFEAADRRKAALQEFVNKYASDLASVPAEEFRLSRLKEEVESSNRVYQTWQEQAASTHIAKAVQSSKVGDLLVVLEPPKMPLVPFAPEKKNIFVLAAFMGIGLGIGTAVLIEYLDMSLKSVEDIEEVLALPILGTVPRMQAAVIEDMELRRRNRIRILVPATLLTVLALAIATWFLLTQNATVG